MVRIKARKPNVAKEPTLPVGQPDRPLSKCLLSNVAIKLWELEEAKMSKTQITKQICFSLIFTVLLDNKTARVWLEFCEVAVYGTTVQLYGTHNCSKIEEGGRNETVFIELGLPELLIYKCYNFYHNFLFMCKI
jgi:hypothetical protein